MLEEITPFFLFRLKKTKVQKMKGTERNERKRKDLKGDQAGFQLQVNNSENQKFVGIGIDFLGGAGSV